RHSASASTLQFETHVVSGVPDCNPAVAREELSPRVVCGERAAPQIPYDRVWRASVPAVTPKKPPEGEDRSFGARKNRNNVLDMARRKCEVAPGAAGSIDGEARWPRREKRPTAWVSSRCRPTSCGVLKPSVRWSISASART